MTTIQLFEFAPTRSSKPRWALLEAGLEFESVGNDPSIIGSDELRAVHPLGKLPAAIIDGKPLFESSAIVNAIADLVPHRELIPPGGTFERALHDQWVLFATTELEMWAWSTMLNTWDFFLPAEQRIAAIAEQNERMFKRGASVLEQRLGDFDYVLNNRFSATDIIVGYAVNLGRGVGFLDGLPNVTAYIDRLLAREYCTLAPPS